MSAQSIAVAQPKDSFPFMLVMSIAVHVIAILFALVAPYILPERSPSVFGGGGNGGLKVVGVIDFGKGKPGKQTTTPLTEEEPAPAKQIAKVNKEEEPEKLDSKLTLPEEKPKKKDEPTAKSTLNQKERKNEGDFGTGKSTQKDSGISGNKGKSFGISTAGSGGGPGDGAFGPGGTPFPFPWYVENVLSKLELNWVKPYVQETTPQEYSCTVYFVITRAGQVRDVKIEHSSGIPTLDLSAESAIRSSTPFPPLPNQWTEPDLAFRVTFTYNREEFR